MRHFEDAARIIAKCDSLVPLEGYAGVRELASDMLEQKQLWALPSATHEAFTLVVGARTDAIRVAHRAIAPMYFGPRISLDDACAAIRGWIAKTL